MIEEITIYDIVIVGGGAIGLHLCMELMENHHKIQNQKILHLSAKGGSFCVAGGFIPPPSIFKFNTHAQKGATIHAGRALRNKPNSYHQVSVVRMDLDIVKNECGKQPGSRKYKGLIMDTNKFKNTIEIEKKKYNNITSITGKLVSWKKEHVGVTSLNCKEQEKEFQIFGRRVYLATGVGSISLDLPWYIKNKI